MAEKKKGQKADFAKDKGAFHEGGSAKGAGTSQRGQQKKSGTHQPRDADRTSGQNVQRSEQTETFGQNVQKSAQKPDSRSHKSRQKKQYQKQDTFGQSEKRSEDTDTGSKKKTDFSQENSAFTEENGKKQEERQPEDDYRRRDTYRQSEKKGRYRRREYQDRERTKNSDFKRDFQTKDTTFTEGADTEFHGSKKLDRLQKKAEKAGKKTEAARKKLPKKTEYSLERVFDEKTGRAKYVLTAVKKEKLFTPDSPVKKITGRLEAEASNFAHSKVAETEKENSAVEGAHKTEQKAEDVYRFVKRHHKSKQQKRRAKVAKLEKKQFKKEVNFQYQKFLEENPQMQKKALQKRLQKQRIKREYLKARQKGASTKAAQEAVSKTANTATAIAKKLQEIAGKNAGVLITVGIVAVLLVMIMTSVSSCGAMFADTQSTVLAASYLSEPAEIDVTDLQFTRLELDLQNEIDNIETDYPGYDEYSYNLGEIGHNPFTLIGYLSAVHTEFTASEVESEVQALFEEMYTLTTTPDTETRTRTVTKTGTHTVTDPVTGEETEEEYEYEEEEEYEVSILRVVLTVKPLETIAAGKMDAEQAEIFAMYSETGGLLQEFASPVDLYWYNYVSSYYGYRKNTNTGNEELHRGVDIAVPTGTTVYAAHDGTVTTAAYDSYYGNYVVIEKDGYTTKYAHMDTLRVSAGQSIAKGTVIGTTGNTGSSTGSHLHIECLYNGEYYNPLFYFDVGEGTLYGETPGGGGVPGNVIPPDSYDDATVQALMEEAAKYLGYPYVWGGSSPSTSFDCSGFVCWVFTNSGVHNLPRTTAQGIYGQCTPVSAGEAKAGDIIFFTGTYNSVGAVSHVGIYCGNGVMIHCGDPISYASINSSYWQSHFYSFGRLN